MLLLIDHYDSFVHMLTDYFLQLGETVLVLKTDQINDTINFSLFKSIILGPGPGHPNDLIFLYPQISRMIDAQVPILGICLGHQILAQYFGAKVVHAHNIMHGQCSEINFINDPLYQDITSPCKVTRYHSLIVDLDSLPNDLNPISRTFENELMAFNHSVLPIYGIQYHPEAYLTEYGLATLQNFLLANKYSI